MSHECSSCGEEFRTLTRKRKHQRDCSEADARIDIGEKDADEVTETVTEELLICDVCGTKNDGAESIERDRTGGVLAFTIKFECSTCGAWNDNEAVLGGSDDG